MGCSASRSHTLITNHHHPVEELEDELNPPNPNLFSPNCARALSLQTHIVHHPPLCKGDTNHLVSLTSTTYGSLVLIDQITSPSVNSENHGLPFKTLVQNRNPSLISENRGLPIKTQVPIDSKEQSLSSPDTVINTWELMEGLEEDEFEFDFVQNPSSDPIVCMGFPKKPNSNCSIESDGSLENSYLMVENPDSKDSKPLWKHLSEEKLLAKMDPNVGLSYRKALSSKQLGSKNTDPNKNHSLSFNPRSALFADSEVVLPGTEDKIVLYHTSLRGIRRTYEDCCAVRMILRGFRVYVDERDISMDSAYRKELQGALKGKSLSLPRVFLRGKHIGGVDEIKQLNEYGELAKLLEGFPTNDLGYVCDSCGDLRFMPCLNCNGSRKIFEEGEDRLRRCTDCNENGLIRCPNCCA